MGLKPQKGLTNICYFLLEGFQAFLAKVSEVVDPPLHSLGEYCYLMKLVYKTQLPTS